MTSNNRKGLLGGTVCGSTAVGERGQAVIPKEARTRLKIKPGDKFLVVEHHGVLVFLPDKTMRHFLEQVASQLNK